MKKQRADGKTACKELELSYFFNHRGEPEGLNEPKFSRTIVKQIKWVHHL